MSSIDDLMTVCPLKQFIRENLWESYIEKLKKKSIKYLTLYCPPVMDVKHFYKRGYIELIDGVYRGVVGITNDPKVGESYTFSTSHGRFELFRVGLLHELLESGDRDLKGKFAFDAINLDYCNHLFGEDDTEYLSSNLKDIEIVITEQENKACEKFVLFITTRTDNNTKRKMGFAPGFLRDLSTRIVSNINSDGRFKTKYMEIFNNRPPISIVKLNFRTFISLGLVKLILMLLWDHDFVINNYNAYWLIRNEKPPERDLLHIAIFATNIKPRKVEKLKQYGTSKYKKEDATIILDKIIDKEIVYVTEKADKIKLQQKYSEYLESLNSETFDLTIPKPIK